MIKNLFRFNKPYGTNVGQVEMTFDTSGTEVRELLRTLFTRARQLRLLRDKFGRETLYVSTSRSPWQLRIYQKTADIVRIEYVLRRALLKGMYVESFPDVTLLGGIDLSQMASFMRFKRLPAAVSDVTSSWRRDVWQEWLQRRRLQPLVPHLRREFHVDPSDLLWVTRIQLMLDQMRSKFIW